MEDLTDQERAVLTFEKRRWRLPGVKDQAVHDTFGLSRARYDQWLGAIIDKPAALVAEPVLVKRLRRLRDTRRQARRATVRA